MDTVESSEKTLTPEFFTDELQVGGMKVKVVAVEHYAGIWERYGKEIEKLIRAEDHGVVIPEYWPLEFRKMAGNKDVRASTNFDEIMNFFHNIENSLGGTGKRVTLLDPAYNPDFRYIREAEGVIYGGALSAAGIGSGVGVRQMFEKPISRRDLLKLAGIFGASSLLAFSPAKLLYGQWHEEKGGKAMTIWGERTFRRSIVAEGLVEMGKTATEVNGRALLIYPPVHWRSIKYMVQHPEVRADLLSFSRKVVSLFSPKVQESLFLRREYMESGDTWVITGKGLIGGGVGGR